MKEEPSSKFMLKHDIKNYFRQFFQYIQGSSCYNINFTFISSAKGDLVEFVKFEFRTFPIFFAFEKEIVKVFGKNIITF